MSEAIVIFAADNGNRPCPRHVFCKRHARQQAQHHDKCQRQCKLFFHIIPLLFNTINIILLDLAFIYILWETISIVCFLGAIILMDCILILKVRRQPSPSDCNDTPAMPGYRHFLYWLSDYYFIKVPAFISSM